MEFGFQCLIWCNLQKHKEVTCGFVNLVRGNMFLTWKLAAIFLTQLLKYPLPPSAAEGFAWLLEGGILAKLSAWEGKTAGVGRHKTRRQRCHQVGVGCGGVGRSQSFLWAIIEIGSLRTQKECAVNSGQCSKRLPCISHLVLARTPWTGSRLDWPTEALMYKVTRLLRGWCSLLMWLCGPRRHSASPCSSPKMNGFSWPAQTKDNDHSPFLKHWPQAFYCHSLGPPHPSPDHHSKFTFYAHATYLIKFLV